MISVLGFGFEDFGGLAFLANTQIGIQDLHYCTIPVLNPADRKSETELRAPFIMPHELYAYLVVPLPKIFGKDISGWWFTPYRPYKTLIFPYDPHISASGGHHARVPFGSCPPEHSLL